MSIPGKIGRHVLLFFHIADRALDGGFEGVRRFVGIGMREGERSSRIVVVERRSCGFPFRP